MMTKSCAPVRVLITWSTIVIPKLLTDTNHTEHTNSLYQRVPRVLYTSSLCKPNLSVNIAFQFEKFNRRGWLMKCHVKWRRWHFRSKTRWNIVALSPVSKRKRVLRLRQMLCHYLSDDVSLWRPVDWFASSIRHVKGKIFHTTRRGIIA